MGNGGGMDSYGHSRARNYRRSEARPSCALDVGFPKVERVCYRRPPLLGHTCRELRVEGSLGKGFKAPGNNTGSRGNRSLAERFKSQVVALRLLVGGVPRLLQGQIFANFN